MWEGTMSVKLSTSACTRFAHRLLVRGPVVAAGIVVLVVAQMAATAAPGRSVPGMKRMLQPVGSARVVTMRTPPRSSPAHPVLVPVRPMNPAALAAAKRRADAAARSAAPTTPRQVIPEPGTPSAAIFNNLNQPGLSASDEGNGVTPPDTTGA